MFTAMLPGELASSAGNYDGIQTANFMFIIINADNALNPSAKMRIIYTTIQKIVKKIRVSCMFEQEFVRKNFFYL
jgi:hypothetical protein